MFSSKKETRFKNALICNIRQCKKINKTEAHNNALYTFEKHFSSHFFGNLCFLQMLIYHQASNAKTAKIMIDTWLTQKERGTFGLKKIGLIKTEEEFMTET